eukprot:2827581-Rhodomonas_salina.2
MAVQTINVEDLKSQLAGEQPLLSRACLHVSVPSAGRLFLFVSHSAITVKSVSPSVDVAIPVLRHTPHHARRANWIPREAELCDSSRLTCARAHPRHRRGPAALLESIPDSACFCADRRNRAYISLGVVFGWREGPIRVLEALAKLAPADPDPGPTINS